METEARIENWTSIEELVYMSIGTDKGSWWADPSFGSELWLLRKEGKVDNRTAGRLQQMVLESLEWIKSEGLASEITCQAEQAGKNEIAYVVTLRRPNGNTEMVKDTWYALS